MSEAIGRTLAGALAICILVVVVVWLSSADSPTHVESAKATPSIDGKVWCTDNACVIGEFDHLSPQLFQRAIDQMSCANNTSIAIAVPNSFSRIVLVCP